MRRLTALFLSLLLLCGCSFEYVTAPPSLDPDSTGDNILRVHFLDVGQADCILLETDGQYLLIDGGNREDGRFVVSYLQRLGVEKLAAVICTHPHEDHAGGLAAVLAVYPATAIYAPTKTYASDIFDDFLKYTDQQGLEITIPAPGDELILGQAKLSFLGPTKSYAGINDTSIVLMAQFLETRFLFTGDMEAAAEADLLDYWDETMALDVDVLKVGHHGSDTSSSYRFLRETAPEYAIISVGADNSYGHPSEAVTSRLSDAGIPMLRTDELGTILAVTDGYEIAFTWEHTGRSPFAG